MLNLTFFAAFAEADPRVIRLALRLIRDFELTRFRVIEVHKLWDRYGQGDSSKDFTLFSFETLVKMGFIEHGPTARRSGNRFQQTYRIRPAFLMSPKDLKEFFAERQAEEERESIAPEDYDKCAVSGSTPGGTT